MNIERMKILAEHLRELGPDADLGFDMSTFYYSESDNDFRCGTVACIAGHACHLFTGIIPKTNIDEVAAGLLGLTEDESDALFFGYGFAEAFEEGITAKEAANAIDQMIAGEQAWL